MPRSPAKDDRLTMHPQSWALTRSRVRALNVYEFTGFGPAKLAADAYFKAQALAPISRHHALCDARALRLAYDAAIRESAAPSQTLTPLEGRADQQAAA
jgi:hypothetical protein